MQRMWEGYSRGSCIYQNKKRNRAAYPLWVYAVQERKRAMERLTHPRSSGIKTGYWSPNKKDELIERLAAYEDTGLTPEEIERLKEQHRWIPVEERLPEVPEGTEDDYCPEFNVMIKGAVQATTLKSAPDGTWFDDFGQVYSVIAWMPLPEPYWKEKNSNE